MKRRWADKNERKRRNRERFYRMANELRSACSARHVEAIQRARRREQRAIELRNEPTPSEAKLKAALDKTELSFVHERVVATLIVDFFCPERKTVIEVDGSIHLDPKKRAKDAKRDEILRFWGYKVLHVDSRDVHHDLERTVERIVEFANS